MTDPEDQPEVLPGLIRDLVSQLDHLKSEMEIQKVHIESAINLYHALVMDLKNVFPRLELVERKTFALADRPAQRNCPHCGRKLSNPKATRCGICGKEIYQ